MNALALIAVLAAGLCTAAFNVLFSIDLGRTQHEALTWAVFAVALDVTKWTMLIIVARRWPSLNAVAAILIWLTATTYSFTAAFGFAAATRAQRHVEAQTFREHQVALQAAKQSPLWQSTFSCTAHHHAPSPRLLRCTQGFGSEAAAPDQDHAGQRPR